MASNIIRMVLKLDDKASPELKKTGDAAGSADTKFSKLTTSATKVSLGMAAVGVAAVAMTRAMIQMGQEVADKVNLITDMSVSTGLAVESLENLQLMAKGTGVSIQGMERGLVTFARNLADAREDVGPLSDAMNELGFDANQFEDTDEAFQAVMKSISGVKDKAQQARLMNDAFGMSSKDLAKAMQMQFGQAGKTLDEMGLRIGESAESASQAQRGLALYELVLDKIKRAAFEAFLGGGGFATGLSIVVGLAKGLGTLLVNIKEFTVGLFMAVAKGIYSMQLLIQGELEKSNKAAKEAQAEMARYGGEIVSVLSGDFIKDAVDGAADFQKGLNLLGQEVKADADLLAELDKLQKKSGKSAGEAGSSAGEMADELALARKQLEALTLANTAFAQSLAQSSGQGLVASFQVDELTAAMYGLTSGALADLSEGLSEFETAQILKVVGAMTSLVGEAEAAVSPLSQVQQLLLDDDPVSVIADIAASYKRLARDSETGWLAGAEEEIENLQSMRELLAEMLITQDRLKIIGAEAFAVEVDPFIESLKAAILEAEQELRSSRMEIQASVDEQSLTDIRSSISQGVADGIYLGASTMQSLAGGDVAGAAGGIASAAGASPMVGAVISALGAIAEIGQMTVKEIKKNAKDFAKNLDNGFKVIVKALPHVIQTLIGELPGILIDALFTFGEFILSGELARVIALGVWEGVKGLISAIKSILTSDVQSVEDVRRSGTGFWTDIARLGLNERDNRKDRDRDGWSFASGNAKVAKTGMALIHRGESIIQAGGRAAQDQQHRMGGSGITVNISTAVMDRDVIPRLVREIDRVVGTYGRTTAAFAGG